MYVCPNCQEEIPDRVRETQDECPFCKEPWPGEVVVVPEQKPAEPSAAAPQEAGGGATASAPGAVQRAEPAAEHVHAEPPKSSKAWLFIVLAVVVLGGGGAGLYFFMFKKGKAGKRSGWEVKIGATTVRVGKIFEEDYEYMTKWQIEVRKLVLKYLVDRCESYRAKGFKFAASLHKVERMLSARKKVKELKLEIKTLQGKEVPLASFDWFQCPLLLAFVHKEHAIHVTMTFTAEEQTLGPTLRRSVIEVKGGRYVAGRGTYKSSWDLSSSGLQFPALHKAEVDPSVKALSRNKVRRIKDEPKKINLGGVIFNKTKRIKGSRRGGYLVGVWEAVFKTDTFAKLLESWSVGCRKLKSSLRDLNKSFDDKEKFKLAPLKEEASSMVHELCRGILILHEAAKGTWGPSKVAEARQALNKALEIAQKNINGPLEALRRKVGSDLPPNPWCGDLKKGSACKQ